MTRSAMPMSPPPSGLVNNMRLPGMYADAETGLYYNYQRYYDPATGRYITADPYQDSLNLYVYCYNNPGRLIDPFGLCALRSALGSFTSSFIDDALSLFLFGTKVRDFGIKAWDWWNDQALMIWGFGKNNALSAWDWLSDKFLWILGSKPNDMFTIGGGVIAPIFLIGSIPVGIGVVSGLDRYVMPDGSADWYFNIGVGVGLAGGNVGFDSGSVIPQSELLLNKKSIKGLSVSYEGALTSSPMGVGVGGEAGFFGAPGLSEDPNFGFRKAGPRFGGSSFQGNVTWSTDIGQ